MRKECTPKNDLREPAFVLLGRDPEAPMLIELWAKIRRLSVTNGVRPVSDLEQIEAAERTAGNMRAWRQDFDGAWREQGTLAFDPVMPELWPDA